MKTRALQSQFSVEGNVHFVFPFFFQFGYRENSEGKLTHLPALFSQLIYRQMYVQKAFVVACNVYACLKVGASSFQLKFSIIPVLESMPEKLLVKTKMVSFCHEINDSFLVWRKNKIRAGINPQQKNSSLAKGLSFLRQVICWMRAQP